MNVGSSHRLKHVKYFVSSYKKIAGWKVAISSVWLNSKPEKSWDPVQPQESFRAHYALASGFTRQLVDIQQSSRGPVGKGTTCSLLFFWTVWIFPKPPWVQLLLYRSALESLKVQAYIHWSTAKPLSFDWRTQQRWRTIKTISSEEVTSTLIELGLITSSYAVV